MRTEKMDSHVKKNSARAFAVAFAESLSVTLAAAIGVEWPLEAVENAQPLTNKEPSVHFRLTIDGALRGDCFVEFLEAQVVELAAKIRQQPATDLDEAQVNALTGAVSASGVRLAQTLSSQFGEVTVKAERVAGLAFGGMFVVPLASPVDRDAAPVLLYFDNPLLTALAARGAKGAPEESAEEFDAHNLKLVMDVELSVSLRFGQRQLPLREVLALSSGSVVELDRMVDEPVELFLDGKLIARGEAVIVDGNYGLRVTEIPQPVSSHFIR